MQNIKLMAGRPFPNMSVPKLDGGSIEFGKPQRGADWHMVLVYRGKHCPLCTKYLAKLKEMDKDFLDLGVDITIVSADTHEKASEHAKVMLEMPMAIGYDLQIEQMKTFGLYISHPRSPEETDRPFSEPGLFIINQDNNLHVVDISNNPFVRPELESLLSGIRWIRDPQNNYPIRGTYE